MLSGMRSFSSSSVASGLPCTSRLQLVSWSEFGGRAELLAYSVEMEVRLPGIGVVDEVILRLLEFRVRDDVSVEQSLAVVL